MGEIIIEMLNLFYATAQFKTIPDNAFFLLEMNMTQPIRYLSYSC